MCKKIMAIAFLLGIPLLVSASEIIFGVEPHTVIKSSYIGCKIGSFLPFMGLDVAHLSTSTESHYEDWDTDESGNLYKSWQEEEESNLSALLFIPHIGGRFYFGHSGAIPYLSASLFNVLPLNVNSRLHSEEWEYDSLGNVVWHSDTTYEYKESDDYAKDILGIFGFSLGFGVQYHFAPYFSISGEYGLNYYSAGGHYKEEESYPDDKDIWDVKSSGLLGLTYSRVQLNFHIGAKE